MSSEIIGTKFKYTVDTSYPPNNLPPFFQVAKSGGRLCACCFETDSETYVDKM